MDIKSYNKALAQQVKKALDFAFTKEVDPADEEVFYCCDTDTVKYKTIATQNRLRLIFTCVDLEHIWKYCADHLVHKYFQSTTFLTIKVTKFRWLLIHIKKPFRYTLITKT